MRNVEAVTSGVFEQRFSSVHRRGWRMPGQILREEEVEKPSEIQSDLKKPWCYCMI